MTALVRCGDCDAPLSRRAVKLARLERLAARHRRLAGCACEGIILAPVQRQESTA